MSILFFNLVRLKKQEKTQTTINMRETTGTVTSGHHNSSTYSPKCIKIPIQENKVVDTTQNEKPKQDK